MKMKLFDNYLSGISNILNKDNTIGLSLNTSKEKIPRYFEKGLYNESFELTKSNSNNKVLIEFDRQQLIDLFGENPNSFYNTTIGTHPDFADIKHSEYTKHYCVTMFMDIKGSTRLNERYSLLEIRKIKDTILTLSIHVASHFGGHIHRLQGDGVLIQFVRKGQKEQDAVINALNTASVLSHFISNDLAMIFESNNVKPLGIRIGIDLGFKNDVVWSHYGIPNCSELTTTSLHTDLAAKLQAKAPENGILLGGNIKEILDIKPEFCQDVIKDGNVDYYIYKGNKNYRKFIFNWGRYLNSFDFTRLSSERKGVVIDIPKIRIKCEISDKNEQNTRIYYQNSNAIPKESKIKYTLIENGHHYYIKNYEEIEWKAYNSGEEAKQADPPQEKHDFGGRYKNDIHCLTKAAFKGHHYVECIIKRKHSTENKKVQFPIFVE